MNLIGPTLHRERDCEAVLRSLPEWFGIEEALLMYARDSGRLPTFGLEEASGLVAFLSLKEHFPESWGIHCIAVAAQHRNAGLGSLLLGHAEEWLLGRNARFLQVKTVADDLEDANYADTRAFYVRRGFCPSEVFPDFWAVGIPALQMIKTLQTA